MAFERRGSWIGAVFGLVYVLVNAGDLPSQVSTPVRALGVITFIGVLVMLIRFGQDSLVDASAVSRLGGGYWAVVGAEVTVAVAGIVVINGPLRAPHAILPWISLVVGAHFIPLAGLFRSHTLRLLGGAIMACGLLGFVLVSTGASRAAISAVCGIVPGTLLLAGVSWEAIRKRTPRRAVTVR